MDASGRWRHRGTAPRRRPGTGRPTATVSSETRGSLAARKAPAASRNRIAPIHTSGGCHIQPPARMPAAECHHGKKRRLAIEESRRTRLWCCRGGSTAAGGWRAASAETARVLALAAAARGTGKASWILPRSSGEFAISSGTQQRRLCRCWVEPAPDPPAAGRTIRTPGTLSSEAIQLVHSQHDVPGQQLVLRHPILVRTGRRREPGRACPHVVIGNAQQ